MDTGLPYLHFMQAAGHDWNWTIKLSCVVVVVVVVVVDCTRKKFEKLAEKPERGEIITMVSN